jgi:hypothetical protein
MGTEQVPKGCETQDGFSRGLGTAAPAGVGGDCESGACHSVARRTACI